MKSIQSSDYSDLDQSILKDEFVQFKHCLKNFNKTTPYYTYALCKPNGTPFYIGKGKGLRAWNHLKNFINGKKINRFMAEEMASIKEPPIMFIIEGNLTEIQALEIEEYYISSYGRKVDGGILSNIMPHSKGCFDSSVICAYAGTIGGKNTKQNKSGIFSDSHDRSEETKRRWEEGIINKDCFNGFAHTSAAGLKTKNSQKGIFDPNYDRSLQGKKQWDLLPDEIKQQRIESFKQTGKNTAKIPLWTDGKTHKKSMTRPGENWVIGQIQNGKIVEYTVFNGKPVSEYY